MKCWFFIFRKTMKIKNISKWFLVCLIKCENPLLCGFTSELLTQSNFLGFLWNGRLLNLQKTKKRSRKFICQKTEFTEWKTRMKKINAYATQIAILLIARHTLYSVDALHFKSVANSFFWHFFPWNKYRYTQTTTKSEQLSIPFVDWNRKKWKWHIELNCHGSDCWMIALFSISNLFDVIFCICFSFWKKCFSLFLETQFYHRNCVTEFVISHCDLNSAAFKLFTAFYQYHSSFIWLDS